MSEGMGFLGPAGSFGWHVAGIYASGAKQVPYDSHGAVIAAVGAGKVKRGVAARENNSGGNVKDTENSLIGGSVGIRVEWHNGNIVYSPLGAMICGEFVLPVEQCLYLPTSPNEVVENIYSHPQGIEQCLGFIADRFPDAELAPVNSTVAGVARLKEDASGVAIAPPWAGDFYPGEVVLSELGIQDEEENYTTFLIFAKKDSLCTKRDKTSICFTVPGDEEAGSFDKVSQILACCNVNKRLIASRSIRGELGKYIFLMDFDGHREDLIIKRALELIVTAGLTTTLTILGSYPRWIMEDANELSA